MINIIKASPPNVPPSIGPNRLGGWIGEVFLALVDVDAGVLLLVIADEVALESGVMEEVKDADSDEDLRVLADNSDDEDDTVEDKDGVEIADEEVEVLGLELDVLEGVIVGAAESTVAAALVDDDVVLSAVVAMT